jgi:hypothetical protein
MRRRKKMEKKKSVMELGGRSLKERMVRWV